MSPCRLLLTAAAMAAIGALLRQLAPGWPELAMALLHPQRLIDLYGADALVLCGAGALAELVWAWGALGLLLTAAGALPGAAGGLGRLLARAVLPAGARRAAAVVLGVGIGLNGPLLAGTALAASVPIAAGPVSAALPVPDWPTGDAAAPSSAAPAPVPDWPAPAPTGAHVVLRGECLWTIAADQLAAHTGRAPADAEIASAVQAWWQTNASVIGPDPDLVLPGQVLLPPPSP